jgi:hypothetical protein
MRVYKWRHRMRRTITRMDGRMILWIFNWKSYRYTLKWVDCNTSPSSVYAVCMFGEFKTQHTHTHTHTHCLLDNPVSTFMRTSNRIINGTVLHSAVAVSEHACGLLCARIGAHCLGYNYNTILLTCDMYMFSIDQTNNITTYDGVTSRILYAVNYTGMGDTYSRTV